MGGPPDQALPSLARLASALCHSPSDVHMMSLWRGQAPTSDVLSPKRGATRRTEWAVPAGGTLGGTRPPPVRTHELGWPIVVAAISEPDRSFGAIDVDIAPQTRRDRLGAPKETMGKDGARGPEARSAAQTLLSW